MVLALRVVQPPPWDDLRWFRTLISFEQVTLVPQEDVEALRDLVATHGGTLAFALAN